MQQSGQKHYTLREISEIGDITVKTFLIVLCIVLATLLLLLLALMLYFFFYAFYRRDTPSLEDMTAPENRFIGPFAAEIAEGIAFINSLPYEQVYTRSYDGLRLAGKYYPVEGLGAPDLSDSDRTMILFHGYHGSGKRDYSCAVKMYMELGYNILLIDERANGESEGKLITFGVKERYDVLSWINFVLSKQGADTKICLGGLSMGAAVVMMAAGLNLPKNVVSIVADCGFTSPAEILAHVANANYHLPGKIAVGCLNVFCKLFGGFSLYQVNTTEALATSDIPILFIHGKADNFVPCYMTERSFEAAKAEKYICLVKGAGHGLAYLMDKETVGQALKSFLSCH